MDLQEYVNSKILQPESETVEYKAVLPPSKSIAQIICSFANTQGGILILGVSTIGGLEVSGLSEDFRATSITHKAIDLISSKPNVDYGYVRYKNKKLFAIRVDKSTEPIDLDEKIYIREGARIILANPVPTIFKSGGYSKIADVNFILDNSIKVDSTNSKVRLVEHYQTILKMLDNLKHMLYPQSPDLLTEVPEGKVLSRILFASLVDNFETYLSDILFEIYLAKPETLKSEQMVKVEDVLNCADIQEFITFWAKQKIGKLQKGSVKGFIAENKQIRDLNVVDKAIQNQIEKILQIRHLYSHRNGIVDDKFLKFFPAEYSHGAEHLLSVDEILIKIQFLSEVVDKIDAASMIKYKLSKFGV